MKPKTIFNTLLMATCISSVSVFAQQWQTGGNALNGNEFLGSTNNQPLSFRANGIELLRMDPLQYRFIRLQDNAQGIMTLQPNGVAGRLNFTGNANHVLRGNGTFGPMPVNVSGNNLFTAANYNVGIGVANPTEKLVVNGNILVQGTVTAANLNQMGMMAADSATIEKMMRINQDLKIEGGDVAGNPNEKNEISTQANDLFIQSKPGASANVIFGDQNASRMGIGTSSPTEKLEVAGGDVKLGGELKMPLYESPAGEYHFAVFDQDGKLVSSQDVSKMKTVFTQSLRPLIQGSYNLNHSNHFMQSNCVAALSASGQGLTEAPFFGHFELPNDSTRFLNLLSTCGKVLIGSRGFNSGIDTGEVSAMKQLEVAGDAGVKNLYADTLYAAKTQSSIVNAQQYRLNGVPLNFSQWQNSNNYVFRHDRVGVGTHNPEAMVHIYNTGQVEPLRVSGTARVTHPSNTGQNLSVFCDGANAKMDFNDQSGNTMGRLLVNCDSHRGTVFGSHVQVNGTVDACKVLVEGHSWCDYVFDEKYALMPLEELDKYISENKHLPEIPASAEVENKKIDLFAMQQLQMKKIEELTLYVIAMKKENTELRQLLTNKK